MAVSSTLTMLLFSLVLCTYAREQRSPLGRRSRRDTMAAMFSFFSTVEKRLAAVEARFDNSTEERLARLETKMEGEMQENLQTMQDGMQRLESTMNVIVEKMAEMAEFKANASKESAAFLEATRTEPQYSSATYQYKYQYQFEREPSRSSGEQELMKKLESELTRLQEKMLALNKHLQDNDLSVGSLHNGSLVAMAGIVNSVTEHVVDSEQNLNATMRNAIEILTSLMNETKVHLLANMAALNTSIVRVEQTTKELATSISTLEEKLDNCTSHHSENCTMGLKTLSGPELAAMMKVGTRVVRGVDWMWGNQDGTPPGQGRVIEKLRKDQWIRVKWDSGGVENYRMGSDDKYDLQLAEPLKC